MRKLLFFMLALICAIMPARAYDFMVDGLCYNYYGDGTTVAVTYERASTNGNGNGYSDLSGELTIPESVTHDGTTYPVVAIGDYAFYNCTGLTKVDMPNTVTAIGKNSFYGCSTMTSAELPSFLSSIGEYAFRGCNRLTSLTIPETVTSLGRSPFYGCTRLTSVVFNAKSCTNESYSYAVFSNCTNLISITFGNEVEIIPDALCYYLDGLTSVTIPSSVTSIGRNAFYSCSGLMSLSLPSSVTTIGQSAFYSCSGLTSVEIPNSVISIGESAFSYCSSLTTISIPNSITEINSSVFSRCTGLTSVDIPNSVTTIGASAFYGCKKLGEINIPNSVISIGSSAFSGCSGLTSATIPNSVRSIGSSAFNSCSGLTSVTIPSSVTSIGVGAFSSCSGLVSVVFNAKSCTMSSSIFDYCYYLSNFAIGNEVEIIPAYLCYDLKSMTFITIPISVASIGKCAFYGCTGLTAVDIPNSVVSIGSSAFYGCTGLTSMTIPNSVTSIGSNAFENCLGITSLVIGNSLNSIGSRAFYSCTDLSSIVISNDNKKYDSRNNCNAIIETATNTLFYGCKGTVIPNTVTTIGQYAFEGCTGLTSVPFPSSVTSIGSSAFYNCKGLTSVVIPSSVTKLGSSAFQGCSNLTSVVIPNSVTSIGSGVFSSCSSVNSLSLIGKGTWKYSSGLSSIISQIKTLYIGSGITSLGSYGFKPTKVYCNAETPPTCTESTFGIYTGELHVPVASIAAYFTATYWEAFNGLINDLSKVTLNETSANLVQWDTLALTATSSPGTGAITWTTNNPKVAVVDENGVVTATGGGECDVYATLESTNDACYAICHVTVSYPEISLSLSDEAIVMNIAEEHELTATITPDNTGLTPTWTSSNVRIATVENGVVTAVKEGECDITATVLDKTVTCHVTVTNNMILTLSTDKAIVGASQLLTVYPSCTPDVPVELVVTSSDPSVAAARVVTRTNAPAEGLLAFPEKDMAVSMFERVAASSSAKAPTLAGEKAIMILGIKNGTATITVTTADGNAEPAVLELRVVDINGDNVVTAADVTALYDYLLNNDMSYYDTSDVNGDGNITSSDITLIYNLLLN